MVWINTLLFNSTVFWWGKFHIANYSCLKLCTFSIRHSVRKLQRRVLSPWTMWSNWRRWSAWITKCKFRKNYKRVLGFRFSSRLWCVYVINKNIINVKDTILLSGCPFDVGSCVKGFSYYGFVKFLKYPENCTSFGVVVSSQQFNVHILGNGHVAVYVWMSDAQEW